MKKREVLCNPKTCDKERRRILTSNKGINLMQISCPVYSPNTMSSQEFFLIPKENYVEEQTKSSEVLFDPTITEKAKQLTLLQRQKPTVGIDEKSGVSQVAEKHPVVVGKGS